MQSRSALILIFTNEFPLLTLCVIPLVQEKNKSWPKKRIKKARVEVKWWEPREQLPRNWGHSNGENKTQETINKWGYMPKEDDNEFWN